MQKLLDLEVFVDEYDLEHRNCVSRLLEDVYNYTLA